MPRALYLYFVWDPERRAIWTGTTVDPERRLRSMEGAAGRKLELLAVVPLREPGVAGLLRRGLRAHRRPDGWVPEEIIGAHARRLGDSRMHTLTEQDQEQQRRLADLVALFVPPRLGTRPGRPRLMDKETHEHLAKLIYDRRERNCAGVPDEMRPLVRRKGYDK